MQVTSRIAFITSLLLGLFITACSHYQAGDGTQTPFSSLQIEPVVNNSLLPQANEVINHDLRTSFIQRNRVTLENERAEAQLKVTLSDYSRTTIARNSQDTGLARKYSLSLSANCTLVNTESDTPYFTDRPVTVSVDIFLDSGQTQSETNALPLLSKKLAEAIANEVLMVW